MVCVNCGKEVSEKTRFCPHCGEQIMKVSGENETEYAGTSLVNMETAVHVENLAIAPVQPVLRHGKYTKNDKKDIKKAVIMMTIGLAGLALYMGIVFFK